MSRVERVTHGTVYVLLAVGLLALGYTGYVIADARVYQAVEQRRFEQAADGDEAIPALIEGGPIGEIRIERLGLAAVFVQGDSAAVLRRAVGHLATTALPGEPGNIVLAGHRDTFFRPLMQVQVGDVISLSTRVGEFEYLVESTSVVQPTDVEALQSTVGRTLTLITCYPFSYIGPAPSRFIVRARQLEGPKGQRIARLPKSSNW